MTQSTFTHQYRLQICAHCGASLPVAPEGGATTCRYCNATSVFQPRVEIQDIASLRGSPATDEYDRYQKLKAQESRQMLAPPGLEHLIVAGQLPVQLLPEAQREWQAMVGQVQGGAPMGVQERFFFLSYVLAQTLGGQGPEGEARRRGVLETAIELLSALQHRSQLRAMMTRDAVRHGDLGSAEAWLAGCDPRSYDLFVDSEYRCAAAYVAAGRRDWGAALQLLGQREGDVPVAHPSKTINTMLRVHALEQSGQGALALQQLRALAAEEHLDDLVRVQARHASLQLCAGTLGALVAEARQPASPAEAPRRSGFGSPITVPFVLAGLGMVVGGLLVDPRSRTDDDMMPLNYFLWLMGGFFLLSGAGSGLMVRALSSRMGLSGVPDSAHWKRASGRIVSVQSTGWTINDLPQLAVRLQVFHEQLPIYEVDTKICVPPHQVGELKPGVGLVVLVDPSDPRKISLAPG